MSNAGRPGWHLNVISDSAYLDGVRNMSISATIKAKQLNGVVPWGAGYRSYVEIDVEELDISDAVTAEEMVPECQADDLLSAIGLDDVISWIERSGYTVTED